MARKLRVQYPGAVYHVMSRGNRDIFVDDVDRQDFLQTLAETCQKTDWQIHAYCLMDDHFHLVVETPNANLVEGMRWMLGAYTIRLNHRHHRHGHVFGGRYKTLFVEGKKGYLKSICDYVHLTPERAQQLRKKQRLTAYPWSSLVWYLEPSTRRPGWMRVDRLLSAHGIKQDTVAGRRQFEKQMEALRLEGMDNADLKAIRRGWCFGGPEFKKQLLEKMAGKPGANRSGKLKRETAEVKAERIIREELKRLGWKERELSKRRKSDPEKLAIAARLRKETTMTVKKIAERVKLGSPESANVRLYQWMRENA